MHKRGQISIFLLLGIIILILAAMMLFIDYKSKTKSLESVSLTGTNIDLEGLKAFTEKCIEDTLREGVFEVGYDNMTHLEAYIDNFIPGCTGGFSGLDMDIKAGTPNSSAFLTSTSEFVVVEVYYPLSITRGEAKSELDMFKVQMDLTTVTLIPLSGGQAAVPVNLVSADRRSSIFIPQGTAVGVPLGLTNTLATISAIDVNDAPVDTGYVLGNLIYDLQPEGMTFNPPITFTISYDPDILPVPEDDLVISYNNGGLWVPLPSTVDKVNDVVYADLDHFSEYTVTCGSVKCWNVTFNFTINATINLTINLTMNMTELMIDLSDTCLNLTNTTIDFTAMNLTNITLNLSTIDLTNTTMNLTDLCLNLTNST